MKEWPNLFLPGAPKAGTTALWEYLRTHPDIFFCDPKEPQFFDGPSKRAAGRYLRLFSGQGASCRYRGDASTCYLSSSTALQRIEAVCGRPTYIVCLRNPVDLVHALHWEHVLQGIEPEQDFATAWSYGEQRRRTAKRSSESIVRRLLVYPDMGLIGRQVDGLLRHVDRGRVFFVIQEEMRNDPLGTYRRVVDFLGLPDDGRTEFKSVNPASIPRSWLMHHAIQGAINIRRRLGIRPLPGLFNSLYWKFNRRYQKREPLPPVLRSQIAEHFLPDISLLEERTGIAAHKKWQDFKDNLTLCSNSKKNQI